MKLLDYFLLIGAVAFLVAAYFVNDKGNVELGSVLTLCATVCSCIFGGRLGGRNYQKNKENK
jgi:hypothetical protein